MTLNSFASLQNLTDAEVTQENIGDGVLRHCVTWVSPYGLPPTDARSDAPIPVPEGSDANPVSVDPITEFLSIFDADGLCAVMAAL